MKRKTFLLVLMMVAIMGSLWSQYGGSGSFEKMAHTDEVTTGFYVIGSVLPTPHTIGNTAGIYAMENMTAANQYWIRAIQLTTDLALTTLVDPEADIVYFIEKNETSGNYTIKKANENLFLNWRDGTNVDLIANPGNNSNWSITGNTTTGTSPFLIQSVQGGSGRQLRFRAELSIPRFNTVASNQGSSHAVTLFKLEGEMAPTPSISGVTQITSPPPANQNLAISATVAYEGAFNVVLRTFMDHNLDGQANDISMTNTSGDVYTATIPSAQMADGTRIELQVVALYDGGKSVSSPEQRFFVGITPIIKIRENLENGMPRFMDYLVAIKGVSLNSAGVISTAPTDFFLQDETAAVGVYQNTATPVQPDVLQGYEYTVVGRIAQFRGRMQIATPDLITQHGIGVLPQPYINTASYFTTYATAERYEGSLIRIKNVSLVEGASWPTSGTAAVSVGLTDGTATIDLRVLPALFGTAPVFPTDIVAMLSQYSGNNPPHHEDYQIFVRDINDFYPTDILPVTLTLFTAEPAPNEQILIRWRTESESNMNGYVLYRNTSNDIDSKSPISALFPAHNTPTIQNYEHLDKEVLTNVEYFYWLEAIENDGSGVFFGPYSITLHEDGIDPIPIPTMISSVYPNPVSIGSNARFDISVKATEIATLKIFNIRGQLVKEFEGISGNQEIEWDKKDSSQRDVAAGIYFYQLTSPNYFSVQRMVILK